MIGTKGVSSVWVSKAKGHATEEAVATGAVRQEDKDGNDTADLGAEKGSGETQKLLMELAGLFSFRNEKYKQLMERIQKFIVAMKRAEKTKGTSRKGLLTHSGCALAKM